MIYIDFDRTLFNTDLFIHDLEYLIKFYKIDIALYNIYKEKLKDIGFNPYRILEEMSKIILIDKKIYHDIDNLVENSYKYLYSDAKPFLENLKKSPKKIILLTKGNSDFQRKKINNTGILEYFDEIIVTLKNKGDLDINYESSIFIDDNPLEIESIMKNKVYKMIRIKRENTKYRDILIEPLVLEVNNLDDIITNLMI